MTHKWIVCGPTTHKSNIRNRNSSRCVVSLTRLVEAMEIAIYEIFKPYFVKGLLLLSIAIPYDYFNAWLLLLR